MNFSHEILEKASKAGSKKIADAFSMLSRSVVDARVSKFESVPLKASLERLSKPLEGSVVVYAQLLSGVPGASLLVMSRENALVLVDLLNGKEPGSTGILDDIDRSAIKETLNILSNSYMTAISETAGMDIGLGVPSMIPSTRFNDIVHELVEKDAGSEDLTVLFETTLVIVEHEVRADFSLLFNERLATLISAK